MPKRFDIDQDITAEAAAWVARIDSGNFSAADRQALRAWMEQSPGHAEEIRAIAAMSMDLAMLTELSEPLAAEIKAMPRPLFGKALALVATALVVMVLGTVAYTSYLRTQTVHQFYATAIGEYRTTKLVDGSSIKLNTNSAVEVIFDGATREVRLLQGEAFFEVAHNPSRPFIVYAATNAARAVGTAFSVRLFNDKTELIVTKGIVEFSNLTMPSPSASVPQPGIHLNAIPRTHPVLVKAGYELSSKTTTPQEETLALTPAAQKWKLSWTEGLLDFSDTPLSEVVNEVSRHTTLQIVITDKTLGDIKFGGVFRVGDVRALLDTLPRVGIVVAHVSDNEVRLYSENDVRRKLK